MRFSAVRSGNCVEAPLRFWYIQLESRAARYSFVLFPVHSVLYNVCMVVFLIFSCLTVQYQIPRFVHMAGYSAVQLERVVCGEDALVQVRFQSFGRITWELVTI